MPSRRILCALAALVVCVGLAPGGAAGAASPPSVPAPMHVAGAPDLGPNVYVFTPSMSTSDIQTTVDAIANQQVSNQFGTQRYALLFEPGTYGTSADPLNFRVGYYTEVAGLGSSPHDVVINGSIDVYNQCFASNNCIALDNFWRSLSNLTINVSNPNAGCYTGEFWAVSQAAPMRRVIVNGNTTLMDYCTSPSYASGGFIADSSFSGGNIVSGSQQQFYVRNTDIDSWTNGVWNQVFSGDPGAPAQCFPADSSCGGPYTTLATTPASRERPFLYVTGSGQWRVFVPSAARDTSGPSWSSGSTPGRSLPLARFFVAQPADSAHVLNRALAHGANLLLTPGVYQLDRPLRVRRPNTIVLGLGLATVTPTRGTSAITVAGVPGVDLAGLTVDAGARHSKVLVKIGRRGQGRGARASDPTALQDVFFRIGGPHAGRATTSLLVNTNHVILDDIWAWRADHGTGVGWTVNRAAHGLVVNGDSVTATGMFVEHYQKYQVIWRGRHGTDVFFQSEMPYDPPSQAAWMSHSGSVDGYAAVKVTPSARGFTGYGMGTYSFFNQGVPIFAARAYEVPTNANVRLHDLLTIFLDATNGSGGIEHVVNDAGGSSTAANADIPVTVVNYP